VRKLTDAAPTHCQRTMRWDLHTTVLQVVSHYPDALKDVINGAVIGVIGPGLISLTAQLVARVKNIQQISICVSGHLPEELASGAGRPAPSHRWPRLCQLATAITQQ